MLPKYKEIKRCSAKLPRIQMKNASQPIHCSKYRLSSDQHVLSGPLTEEGHRMKFNRIFECKHRL